MQDNSTENDCLEANSISAGIYLLLDNSATIKELLTKSTNKIKWK